MDENQKIRERILSLLKQKKISRADLAASSGVSYSGITQFLSGYAPNASIDFLAKLCHGLGVSLSDLVADTESAIENIQPKPASELAALMEDLTPEDQRRLLDVGKALKYGFQGNKKAS